MKHKITITKIKRIHFYETLCVKKREIQYYAMIRMGGGGVINMVLQSSLSNCCT